MFVFPANNRNYRSRKKAYRACVECKRGRKRCILSDVDKRCQNCVESGFECSLVPFQERKTGGAKNPAESSDHLDVNGELDKVKLRSTVGQDASSNSTQFISHLDPSTDLMMAGSCKRLQQQIGIWVSKSEEENVYGEGSASSSKKSIPIPPTLDRFLLSHLNALHAFEFPPDDIKKKLLSVYFEYVDPVVPIVDKNAFLSTYTNGNFSVPLLHAILMTAARHSKSIGILDRPRAFAVNCNRKVHALLYAKIETSVLVLTRIHALLSLYSEGPEGFKEGACSLAIAFHYGTSVGIHLRATDGTEHTSPTPEAEATNKPQSSLTQSEIDRKAQRLSTVNLWWSIWCLDLCSSCVNGMPLKSHPRDIGVSVDSPEDGPQGNLFRRFVAACQTLDATINLYRPNPREREVPEIVKHASFPDDGTSFMALFRLIHYASILLSYKRVSSLKDEDVPENLLQVAFDIYDLVGKYDDLVPLPIIPYTITLTFSIFLRYFSREDVRKAWKRGCDILDWMGNFWWAAEAMASMARSVFDKLQAEQQKSQEFDFDKFESTENIPDGTLSSFMGQTSFFGELDPDILGYWFPVEEFSNLQ